MCFVCVFCIWIFFYFNLISEFLQLRGNLWILSKPFLAVPLSGRQSKLMRML